MKVYCVFSSESPQRGDSNEYTQNTISQYKKENHPKLSQICNYGICSKGLKNEFERAVVNETSVFEPLKFYCMCCFSGVIDVFSGGGSINFCRGFCVHVYFVTKRWQARFHILRNFILSNLQHYIWTSQRLLGLVTFVTVI